MYLLFLPDSFTVCFAILSVMVILDPQAADPIFALRNSLQAYYPEDTILLFNQPVAGTAQCVPTAQLMHSFPVSFVLNLSAFVFPSAHCK